MEEQQSKTPPPRRRQAFGSASLLAIAALFCGATAAAAQTPTHGDALTPSQPTDEVVVTAQFRPEALADVPISIRSFDAADIKARGAFDSTDLFSQTANVNFVSQTGSSAISTVSIRGVGSVVQGVDQSVAVYIDDVFIGSPASIAYDLFDAQRVEVLRGPQGTLYGRNALGGAVNIIPTAPRKVFEGGALVSYAQDDQVRAEGVVNAPLGDKAAIRASGAYLNNDGGLYNTVRRQNIGGVESGFGRVALKGEVAPWLTSTLSIDGGREVLDGPVYGQVGRIAEQRLAAVAIPGRQRRELFGATLKSDADLGFAHLLSITAYRTVKVDFFGGEFAGVDDGARLYFARPQNQVSQEFRLVSNPGRLRFVLGAFYYHANDRDRTGETFTQGINFGPSFTLPPFTEGSSSHTTTETVAGYGEATYAVIPRLELTAGLRVSRDEKAVDYTHRNSLPFAFSFAPTVNTPLHEERSYPEVTPKIQARWLFDAQNSLYVTISRGYKAGGFQVEFAAQPVTATGQPNLQYKAESLINYEVGYKASLLDHRLQLSVAGFYLDWDDQQVQQYVLLGPGLGVIRFGNAGSSRSYGFDAEADFRLNRYLRLFLGAGYADAQFVKFPGATLANGQLVSANGDRIPFSSKYTLSPAVDGALPLRGDWRLTAHLDATYRSGFYFDVTNLYRQGGFAVFNGRLGVETDRYALRVFAQNLFDRAYYLDKRPNSSLVGTYPLEGVAGLDRRVGVELQAKF